MVTVVYGEVYPAEDGWRFRTLGGNFRRIAWGESYENRTDALDACTASCPNGAQILVRKGDGSVDHSVLVGGFSGDAALERDVLDKELQEAE